MNYEFDDYFLSNLNEREKAYLESLFKSIDNTSIFGVNFDVLRLIIFNYFKDANLKKLMLDENIARACLKWLLSQERMLGIDTIDYTAPPPLWELSSPMPTICYNRLNIFLQEITDKYLIDGYSSNEVTIYMPDLTLSLIVINDGKIVKNNGKIVVNKQDFNFLKSSLEYFIQGEFFDEFTRVTIDSNNDAYMKRYEYSKNERLFE